MAATRSGRFARGGASPTFEIDAPRRLGDHTAAAALGGRGLEKAMPVKPISHRGFWLRREERNTETAFRRSLAEGFGIETDLRDRNGEIVIAHDIGDAGSMSLRQFFDIYADYPERPTLALNIKADGLQDALSDLLRTYAINRYFVFDMSVPDLLGYRKRGLRYFGRISEYETDAILMKEAGGVWLDQFESDWVTGDTIGGYRRDGKEVCVVSPELHGRPHEASWGRYRKFAADTGQDFLLCTDFPTEARDFFQ
jgi:hypothetical protein